MNVPTADLRQILRERFAHDDFREGQLEALEATLAGRDVVAVMPTGLGKSLLYQLPALALPGTTLVVSPLIALMKDQVDALVGRGIAATLINSSLSPAEQSARLRAVAAGEIKLLYVAPERFRNERFREAVRSLQVSLFAIDEAHCISEWGHDFRPDYRRLNEAFELFGRPPVIALTATATPEVRGDIVRELKLKDPHTVVTGFDRKNLFLAVTQTPGEPDKLAEVERTIDQAAGPGIIYVASRKSAERVSDWLATRLRPAGLYHAGLSDGERDRVQDRFMSGELPIIVATNAFGMGIDKSDIRFVIHYEFPKSLEAYYQEVGRAGRDGKPAIARLLFSYVDKRIQEFFIEGANPPFALVADVYRHLLRPGSEVVELSAADIAAQLGMRNDMAVSSALAILERAKAIARDPRPGAIGRGRTIRILERVEPARLALDARLLARKLDADKRKLEAVVQFAYNEGCRKERLLAYFGDTRRRRTCEACDVCERRASAERTLDERERAIAAACLEAVAALDGRFGLMRIAEALVGERRDQGQGQAQPQRHNLESLAVWGVLRHLGRKPVLAWLDALLDHGLLAKEDLSSGTGYVVRITALGHDTLRSGAAMTLAPPGSGAAPAAPPRTRVRASRRPAAAAAAPAAGAIRGQRPLAPVAETPGAVATAGDGILIALKAWRREEARRRAVPAYVVFHDAVLGAIAGARPADRAALGQISGLGPRKLEEYGDAVLEIVRRGA